MVEGEGKGGGGGERKGMGNEKATRSVRKDFIIRPATGFWYFSQKLLCLSSQLQIIQKVAEGNLSS